MKATVTCRVTQTADYTLEDLGFLPDDNPTKSEIRHAIMEFVEQTMPGMDIYVDCEKVELEGDDEVEANSEEEAEYGNQIMENLQEICQPSVVEIH